MRERDARDDAGLFVCEGPHLVSAALDHGAEIVECLVAGDVPADLDRVAARAAAGGVPVRRLPATAAERIGDTRAPQPLFAVVRLVRRGVAALAGADLCVVATEIADPGNAGTLWRGAAAAGASVVVLGAGSVDAYNPKVVRASAGACFAVPIVEDVAAVEVLDALGVRGVQRVAALAHGGVAPEAVDLRGPTALVLGHETRGLPPGIALDARVTIPVAAGESLNVAMAGTALALEAARQRRAPRRMA